jgi:hemolysin activation/secretion protein
LRPVLDASHPIPRAPAVDPRGRRQAAVLLSAAAIILGPQPSGAQPAPGTAPSQVTPPTLRPPAEPAASEGVVLPESTPTAAPAGAESLFVTPAAFIVGGEFPELEAARRELFDPVVGTRIPASRVFELAGQLEQAYARAGYVLVRIVVPPQTVEDGGAVKLTVVDGFVESVDVSAVPAAVRERVRAVTDTLVGRRRITLADIERKLLIAGDTPGTQLRSTLAAGRQDGGTVLVLDGGFRPVTGAAVLDNRLSDALGRWQYGGTLALNSPSGQGDQLYVTVRTGSPIGESFTSLPRLRVAGVGLAVPVGTDGAAMTAEFTDAQTHGMPAPGAADLAGTLRRVALRGTYPLVRTQTETLQVTGLVEHLQQANRSVLLDADISRDRYTAVRVRLDWSGLTPWGAPLSMGVQLSGGVAGLDEGEAEASGVPLSRQGAAPNFRRADASVLLSQPLAVEGVRLNLAATAQTTFRHPVFVSEQYLLDGYGIVTGVPSGALSADRGIAGRAELLRSFRLAGVTRTPLLSPYAFFAYGTGYLEQPTAAEQRRINGRSGGIGARMELFAGAGRGYDTLAIELGRYVTDLPSVPSATRLTVAMYLSF